MLSPNSTRRNAHSAVWGAATPYSGNALHPMFLHSGASAPSAGSTGTAYSAATSSSTASSPMRGSIPWHATHCFVRLTAAGNDGCCFARALRYP